MYACIQGVFLERCKWLFFVLVGFNNCVYADTVCDGCAMQGVWGKIAWLWDLPPVKSVRITITAAQWGMHIPTLLALAATQWSVVFAHVRSLPGLPLHGLVSIILRHCHSSCW
jgi:hypothetical protein